MQDERRPLKTRAAEWPKTIARGLVGAGITPNQVSLASVGFGVLGAALMQLPGGWAPLGLLLGAGMVQLRLLANLLDGLMAVEEGQGTPVGALYNDIPDRFADGFFLVGAGYAVGWGGLGWAAAWIAVLVAYVRFVGTGLVGSHDFRGPMAKPHRMFVLTVALVLSAILHLAGLAAAWAGAPIVVALVVVVVGGLFTFFRRLSGTAWTLTQPDIQPDTDLPPEEEE